MSLVQTTRRYWQRKGWKVSYKADPRSRQVADTRQGPGAQSQQGCGFLVDLIEITKAYGGGCKDLKSCCRWELRTPGSSS